MQRIDIEMNGIVCLCHFCELHGPSVLMSTLPCRQSNHDHSQSSQKFYGPSECLQPSLNSLPACEACQSLGGNIFVSSDHESRTSFVSSHFPWHSDSEVLVRQACTRSLSCEVSPSKEGLLCFSDDLGSGSTTNSCVLSQTFLIQDSLARGFHRWFSIIVLTRDRLLLLNMWPFLETNIAVFVSELQQAASKVYKAEQIVQPQRALRLNNSLCLDRTSRSLAELTGTSHIFAQLHLWFTWLLHGASLRIREMLPVLELTLPVDPLEEVEDGFTLITAKRKQHIDYNSLNNISAMFRLDSRGPSIQGLNSLRSILGPNDFIRIVYCLIVGKQIAVRGHPAVLVASILFTLKTLLPRSCARLVPYSSQYLPLSQCNLLGLEARAAVPQPSLVVARLEVLPLAMSEDSEAVIQSSEPSHFKYHLKWPGQLPAKWPTFLSKLERAMESQLLSESTLKFQITALRMETVNSAVVLKQLENQDKKETGDLKNKSALLQALGISPSDLDVLSFWSKSQTSFT